MTTATASRRAIATASSSRSGGSRPPRTGRARASGSRSWRSRRASTPRRCAWTHPPPAAPAWSSPSARPDRPARCGQPRGANLARLPAYAEVAQPALELHDRALGLASDAATDPGRGGPGERQFAHVVDQGAVQAEQRVGDDPGADVTGLGAG